MSTINITSTYTANLVITLNGVTSNGSTNLNCSLNAQTGSPLSSVFSLSANVLTINAPQNAPVQVNFTLKSNSVAGVNLNFAGIVFNNPMMSQECSWSTINPNPDPEQFSFPLLGNAYSGNVPPGALAVIDINNLPSRGAPYTLGYTLNFTTSGGTTYSWDPDFDNEQTTRDAHPPTA